MNALIVDDDRFVIASLQKEIKWEELGFRCVHTAFNIQEAKRIIQEEQVDFLLSDIDMPNGSGLELLSWLREDHTDLPVIILTNYADFGYLQKAVELKSFRYLLKPIEPEKLTAAIREVAGQLALRRISIRKSRENFWRAFLSLSPSPEELSCLAAQYPMPIQLGDQFLPIIFDLFPYHLAADNTLASSFGSPDEGYRYLHTTYHALFADVLHEEDIFFEYDPKLSRYLAIVRTTSAGDMSSLRMRCEQLVKLACAQTGAVITCYLGTASTLGSFHSNFSALCSMINNQIDGNDRVLDLGSYVPSTGGDVNFPAELLKQHLDNAQYAAFQHCCFNYLQQLTAERGLNEKSIASFHLNVEQILHSFLADRGIWADKLFNNETSHTLAGIAKKSLPCMMMYLTYTTNTISDYFESEATDMSIALIIKEYVDQHYNEDILRADLSNLFHIDASYAVRLFKKKFGMSFKNYIIDKRINVAKELLVTTELPINTISDSVGYGNYSYFTRIFKKKAGTTPVEYRSRFSTPSAEEKSEPVLQPQSSARRMYEGGRHHV